MSFDNVKSWIITISLVVIAISSAYMAIRVDGIIERLGNIAQFIGITGGN